MKKCQQFNCIVGYFSCYASEAKVRLWVLFTNQINQFNSCSAALSYLTTGESCRAVRLRSILIGKSILFVWVLYIIRSDYCHTFL